MHLTNLVVNLGVCAFAAESEYAALFINGQHVVWLRTVLEEMGYKQQQPTWLICDNACAVGIANESVKIKRFCGSIWWMFPRVQSYKHAVSFDQRPCTGS
jgi:hypothetical protein